MALTCESEKHEKEMLSATNITSKERRVAKEVMNLKNSLRKTLSTVQKFFLTYRLSLL